MKNKQLSKESTDFIHYPSIIRWTTMSGRSRNKSSLTQRQY